VDTSIEHLFHVPTWMWEKLHPHVPRIAFDHGAWRAEYGHAGALAANEIVRAATIAQAQGNDAAAYVRAEIAGWCGNEPRRLPHPLPKFWPPPPDPEPWWDEALAETRLAGAVVLATAARQGRPELSGAFAEGARALFENALPQAEAPARKATRAKR
jgi:hypothetical protein